MDANNVEYYSKLVRHRCEKALKSVKIRPKWLPKPLKSIKNRCPDRGPGKTLFSYEKVTFRIPVGPRDWGPKIVENGIQKS